MTSSGLIVEGCDPREREDEIKALFERCGHPEFAAAFDRAYRQRADIGMRSWLGRVDGTAVAHISVSPVEFEDGTRRLKGGICGDLMVADTHRDFWTPAGLLRGAVGDLKRAGVLDFVITTTTAEAEPVFKAGGFKPFARMRRYVLPLSLPYLTFARLRRGYRRRRFIEDSTASAGSRDASRLGSDSCFRPVPTEELYDTRIGREAFADGTWLSVPGVGAEFDGAILVSKHRTMPEATIADGFWRDARGLGELLHAAGRWSRGRGFARLTVSTLDESRLTADLRAAGFFPRAYRSTLLLNVLREAPPPPADWFLTGLPMSGW